MRSLGYIITAASIPSQFVLALPGIAARAWSSEQAVDASLTKREYITDADVYCADDKFNKFGQRNLRMGVKMLTKKDDHGMDITEEMREKLDEFPTRTTKPGKCINLWCRGGEGDHNSVAIYLCAKADKAEKLISSQDLGGRVEWGFRECNGGIGPADKKKSQYGAYHVWSPDYDLHVEGFYAGMNQGNENKCSDVDGNTNDEIMDRPDILNHDPYVLPPGDRSPYAKDSTKPAHNPNQYAHKAEDAPFECQATMKESKLKVGTQIVDGQALECDHNGCDVSRDMSVSAAVSISSESSTTYTNSAGWSLSVTAGVMYMGGFGPMFSVTAGVNEEFSKALANSIGESKTDTVSESLAFRENLEPGYRYNGESNQMVQAWSLH
ncbi:hypothetical protein M011DRAFT_329600 [Sporormia fimetaria CBS 119925]|uniref:Uncharacterized protein n=1 Tax=Sporormia fimetaria CBS 119925 TaxID=1340428 RepID=A0A6A6VHD9_9PLEO|nr:hypothetical protein M011DRAFT_329600 [Sporormia fimetaria CBS 119925]